MRITRSLTLMALLATGCAMSSRAPVRFPAEYLVQHVVILDEGALEGRDVPQDAMLVMVPGEVFDHYEWTKDKDRILAYYRSRGFHQASMDSVDAVMERTGITLLYVIDPGPALVIRSVSVRSGGLLPARQLTELLDLMPGTRMDMVRLELGKGRIRAAYAAEGYVYATAEASVVVENNDAILELSVGEGHPAYVGEVSMVGLRRLKTRVAMRSVRLVPGRLFRPKDVYDTQRRLLGTGLFSSVRILVPGMDSGEDTLRIFVQVREAPNRFMESGVGYASPDRAAVSLSLGHQNVWGIAASTRFGFGVERGWVTDRRQYSTELSFLQPWLLGIPIDAGVTVDYRWRSDPTAQSEVAGTTLELGRSWGERTSLLGRYRYRWRKTDIAGDSPSDYVLEESRRPITNSVGLVLSIDTRTSFTDPSEGQLLRVQITHAGDLLGGDWSFRKGLIDASVYQKVGATILALRATAGTIDPRAGSPTAPEEERFRSGGANSVRGFREEGLGPTDSEGNALGGEAMILFSTELRVPIWKYLGVGLFADCGQVWERASQMRLGDLEPTLGCGLRYATVIGPVRLDWGMPLRDQRTGRIYFTLGHAF